MTTTDANASGPRKLQASSAIQGQAVSVSLNELREGAVPFEKLVEAFGPESLGIIVVRDLPEKFRALRTRLLSYSSYLAGVGKERLDALESPESHYLVGWSLGKETLKSGQYDTLKGSYYVNCSSNFTLSSASLAEKFPGFPEYTAPNVWPSEDFLPGFQETFLSLCDLIIGTAVLVARACDKYAEQEVEGYKPGYLEHVVKSSVSAKARLLHYFPSPPAASETTNTAETDDDDWCATHLDHGCLTGLTSAMFIDEHSCPPVIPDSILPMDFLPPLEELPSSPDPKAGLYIHSRSGEVTQVKIPRDCLAFQTGEALERITKGSFRAVPHFVKGARREGDRQVARNTLAVFTQPNLWEKVDEEVTFAEFARAVVERNH